MSFLITTTGNALEVILNDLGARTLIHPIVNLDLTLEFSTGEINDSQDLQNAINSGFVTVKDEFGNSLTDVNSSSGIEISGGTNMSIVFEDRLRTIATKDVVNFLELSANTFYSGSTELGEVIETRVLEGLSSISTSFLDVYDLAGGTTTAVNTWDATVPFDSQRVADSDYIHSTSLNNDEITVDEDGVYLVMGRVSCQGSNNNRTQGECRLEVDLNQGGGFEEVLGTTSEMYLRQTNYGATGVFSSVLQLSQGQKIRITFRRQSGSSTIVLQPGGSSLTISNMKGTKGEKGDAGEMGSSGPMGGSGCFALGIINSDGTSQYSKNLNSLKLSSGVYEFSFEVPAPDSNYTVTSMFNGSAINVDDWTSVVTSRESTGFTITTTSQDNGTVSDILTDLSFDVTVQGPNLSDVQEATFLSGGTTNQFLVKKSNNDYDIKWESNFRESISDETNSSTTSSSYVQKLRLSLIGLDNANYEIKWYFELGNNGGSFFGDLSSAKVELNDSIVFSEFSKNIRNTEFDSCSGYFDVDLSGDNYIDIDFSAGSGTAEIRKARLLITKNN